MIVITQNSDSNKMSLLKNEKIQDELKKTDLNDLITPNEVFDNIQPYDLTAEVIGYVVNIEQPSKGSDQQIFKFYLLNNGKEKKRVQVIAQGNNITDNLRNIKKYSIVHLDGVEVTTGWYNNGNVRYQLMINENTVVTILGEYEYILDKLSEIRNAPVAGRIMLEAYVKSNFMERKNPNDNSNKFGCGSVTDGTYKLEIHIKDFSLTDYLALGINKGDKIRVTGTKQEDKKLIHLQVENITCIQKLEGYMSFSAILKGHLCIK
ncbi:uncharacterized protein LOC105837589 isoform X1 [Monomorium pharaonis]|uniref:uncharacterized protein LOC105837589 isoform X1 n=2 Tax=Monomorium pharaonis TaxID=307658 RepID=UPI0017474F14|nr:uncharacterized protein LOC105837589 isoform X1 [Monomorium pharaonis]